MKLMVVLGGGGHTEQMLKLVNMLGKKFEYIYVITNDDKVSKKRIEIEGKIYEVKKAVMPYRSILTIPFTMAINFFQSFLLYLRERPNAIISSGPGTAITISFIGKIFRSKVIFIESWSRVKNPSGSGKIIYKFADLFFVQWETLKKIYPKAIFAGRLS
jgi:UDP-N-acetylglucosamine:LPS N-acetylglucosamine transferase